MLFAAIISFAVCAYSIEVANKALMLGWTGGGKTRFCNLYDESYCGIESDSEESTTKTLYFGNYFIDSRGFGDNSKNDGPVSSSMQAIVETLTGLNGKTINAV